MDIAERLDTLCRHEYFGRKYRARGDWAYERGNERSSMEYHAMAAKEEEAARPVREELQRMLGDPGAPELPDAEALAACRWQAQGLPNPWAAESGDFDDACFHARYPRWAGRVPRFRDAHERWQADPRLWAEAPRFRPICPDWEP